MATRIKKWWNGRTLNEKLMYGLIVALSIGIATRYEFIAAQIVDTFSSLFPR